MSAIGRKRSLRFQILTDLNDRSYPKAVIQKRAVGKQHGLSGLRSSPGLVDTSKCAR